MNDIRWHDEELKQKVRSLSNRALYQLAEQIVSYARLNITANDQIDTGFMRLSGYAVGSADSSYGDIPAPPPGRAQAPQATLQTDHEAIAGFAAIYAIYQEALMPFLEPALVQVRGDAEALYQQEARGEGL